MRKTANKRNKIQMPAGIRQKMMAAVSMLMVSSIMLVSSTYAWFTLSTAPEVTGITTNVGANGNLEMMLLTGSLDNNGAETGSYYSEEDNLGVESQVGQSMATVSATVANVTWGNLVDLSDGSYGLDKIVLSPARLNLSEPTSEGGKNTVGPTILNAPSYGSDGRVIDVKTATYTGKLADNKFAYDDAHKGVRVIGTTTDVSQRVAAYRAAKAAVSTNSNAAKNKATASLKNNGQALANILVGYVNNPNATYTNGDLKSLNNVLKTLEEANSNVAAAMKNAVLAYSLSDAAGENKTFTDQEVSDLTNAVNNVEVIESTESFSDIENENVLIPAGLDASIATYKTTGTNIATAISALNGLNNDIKNSVDTEGSYTYAQISPILNAIVDKTYVKIAGQTNLSKDDLNLVVDEFATNGSISMVMLDGSGVYADIAKLVGNYTVSGLKVHVEYGTFNTDVPIVMSTEVSGTGIPHVTKIALGGTPKESGQVANAVLSNTYGYALDFGFRTNAASSDLLLQTAAANRVYADSTEAQIQGEGSYMQFTSSDVNNFSADEVLALMSAVRVAFVDASSSEVLAMGALDVKRTIETNGLPTYTKGTSVNPVGNTGYKAGLFLHEYTYDKTSGIVTLGNMLADKSAITALTQNVASKLTVIVYLDGDIVDNTMVANADTSMTGVLNLQFSSSATLAPMENTGMRNGGTQSTAVTYTVKANAGNTYEYGYYSGTVKTGYTIYDGSDGAIYFSTDGQHYTRLTYGNVSTAIEVTSTPTQTRTTPPAEDDTEDDTTVIDGDTQQNENPGTGTEPGTTETVSDETP